LHALSRNRLCAPGPVPAAVEQPAYKRLEDRPGPDHGGVDEAEGHAAHLRRVDLPQHGEADHHAAEAQARDQEQGGEQEVREGRYGDQQGETQGAGDQHQQDRKPVPSQPVGDQAGER